MQVKTKAFRCRQRVHGGLRSALLDYLVVILAPRQGVILGLATILGMSAALVGEGQAQEVFRYEQTRPVVGMPEIRAARPAGAASYKPAFYQADKGGWVVIADSFADYKAARERVLADARLRALERGTAEAEGDQSTTLDATGQPAAPALVPASSQGAVTSRVQAKPEPAPCPASNPLSPRPGDDPTIRIACGDEARAFAAILYLRSEGLPVTQANMNRALGYASTPNGPRPAGSSNPGGSAPTAAGASVPNAGPAASQGGSPAIAGPVRSFTSPLPLPAQQPGRGLPSPKAANKR